MAVRLPPSNCPYCNRVNDGASVVDEPNLMPQPRDFSVCFGCGQILQFGFDLSLQKHTSQDLEQLRKKEPVTYKLLLTAQAHILSKN